MTLHPGKMSARMARVTNRIAAMGGRATEEQLDRLLLQQDIVRLRDEYKTKMVSYGYLDYDPRTDKYYLSAESKLTATIEISIKPSLYAEEVRRHLDEMLAEYAGLIEIGKVEL